MTSNTLSSPAQAAHVLTSIKYLTTVLLIWIKCNENNNLEDNVLKLKVEDEM